MRKLTMTMILLVLLGITVTYQKEIVNHIMINYIYKKQIVIYDANQFSRNLDFEFVQQTDNFFPKNKQDILNIFYTILNNGWNSFTFYCDVDYKECLDDVQTISHDQYTFSNINNFVNPYNSYNKISINYNNLGKVTVDITKLYNPSDIVLINQKVDQIYNSVTKENMSVKQKIRAIHDYIINKTTYDNERADVIKNNIENFSFTYQSHKAYGPLLQGMAICSGYSDAMALFLNKMGLINYKVSSKEHVWNLVYIDNEWLHLDLTWDDPIVDTNESILVHNYFLITTEELEKDINEQHIYSKEVYSEAK